ncbi:hypothetical protein R5H32_11785 [Defluviimonas sp. D31]|uniref:hypothetical protein n=1 Tax=Defluviimonas sp. D31 TaxID=3083253 RepID=UPI00296F8B71|nr:hypothetical protein [Defluviimonas sp. D31]MDW4550032.1 hypothetical protein [Defluviimonas sp. D31]
MAKLIAILNVIAWGGFWAFGYLALTSDDGAGRAVVATILASVGAAVGIVAWLWLVRHSEATGYARRANQVPREHHRTDGGEA